MKKRKEKQKTKKRTKKEGIWFSIFLAALIFLFLFYRMLHLYHDR
ncbi:MAG: hypothetical protein ACP5F6_09050 [Microbacter sp.]